ncbi:MAG: hypothetical protein KKA65_01670 [Nanoarchaeota archaeon]|nr:hypothetical protein [Nanoarchaeota archaeon]MBU4456185.1 hypothetical protein [Nanoarchaeota archaeon]
MADKKDPSFTDFNNFFARPSDDSLDEYVETVRLSMCENLEREVTKQEAKNLIKIVYSINKAYSSSLPKESPKECNKSKSDRLFSLDEIAADSDAKLNLRDWCFYWERIKDGRVMASAADFYRGIKELRDAYKFGSRFVSKKAEEVMVNLKKDLRDPGIILGTRLDFIVSKKNQNHTTLYAQIIHRYNCQYKKEITTFHTLIPKKEEVITNLEKFASDFTGLVFLQKLLNTHDSIREIELNFNYITGIPSDNLNILIPNETEQRIKPNRTFILKILKHRFFIRISELDKTGSSRGFQSIY